MYREALAQAPRDADCLHMLGVVCFQRGRFEEALANIGRARSLAGSTPAIEHNLALVASGILGRRAGDRSASAPSRGACDAAASMRAIGERATRLPAYVRGADGNAAGSAMMFTGERFVPEIGGAIFDEHWHRYAAAAPIARGRRVLDAACGEGYGSRYLAAVAEEVTGVDVSGPAIAHAQRRYCAQNLRYVEASVTALPLAEASVDVVVSFETIEHLAAQQEMLAEFRRVLTPAGIMVISSPNKPVYSAKGAVPNPFHVRELTRDELDRLLAAGFPNQHWYGQSHLAHSTLWADSAAAATNASGAPGDEIEFAIAAPPTYFVVVCGDRAARLPRLPAISALVRSSDDVTLMAADGLLWRPPASTTA